MPEDSIRPIPDKNLKIVEERVQHLYPMNRARHEPTLQFFDTLTVTYCSALVTQCCTFMPFPHAYVLRGVESMAALIIIALSLPWLFKRTPSTKAILLASGVIVGMAIGL